ncbi:MAG: flavodoxin family protein [bacterium]|nr:flavodoxin family protein [bacterium]
MKKMILVFMCATLILCHTSLYTAAPKKILVVYYSMTGNTEQMAEAAALGAKSVEGINVKLLPVKKAKIADVLEADGIILGTPVHNANIALPMMKFINSWPFEGAPLRNKIGAAFVTAGGISAGEELTQLNILHTMMLYGMIVVGGNDWKSAFGASAITEEPPLDSKLKQKKVDRYFLEKARGLGKRTAEVVLGTSRLRGNIKSS